MKLLLRIFGIILLLLVVLLLPFFGIYASTVQSIPGDKTYSLKQNSEMVIDKLSVVSPDTFAYFSLLKSQRRYQEVLILTEQNKELGDAPQKFLNQSRQTLLDIQSVSDTGTRLNFYAQYQSFMTNAEESITYKIDFLNEELKHDKSAPVKTFTVDQFEGEQGRLISKPKILVQKDINQKEPVADSLLIANRNALEELAIALKTLVK